MKNHFTATGIVFNDAYEILMIKHKKFGVWLPPGGHVDINELPCEAVLREIFEETGISAKVITSSKDEKNLADLHCRELPLPLEILLEDIDGDGSHNHIDMIYLCTAENPALKLHKNEVDDIGWFSVAEIMQLETFDNVRHTVEKAARHFKANRGERL
ncbi:MAG: NUDIX domain-containing protein [Defluviitaleaceae bacterium]|nr:NUDIX domain-containing protein [Defluviitaleaceae bacterium]